MSLFKRHIGRRVAGVGIGVALLVLGLEAPAFAVAPTITSFTPTSGPAYTGTPGGCVVDIIGTNFTNPTVVGPSGVQFNGDDAQDYVVVSDTEIWATVPAAATSGAITVTNGDGTATSSTGFIVATPGGCSPTADSFTPTCGPAAPSTDATEVTITGTNLLMDSSTGADVFFAPYTTTAPSSGVAGTDVPPPNTPDPTLTERTVVVPAGAGDGPIAVETFDDTAGSGANFSATKFLVGTCITDFKPTKGDVGTTVTITGVGFKNVTGVNFKSATGTVPAAFTLTSDTTSTDTITTTVPLGAVTGPITLLTADAPDGKSVSTATDFTVGAVGNARSITLKLRKHLIAKGIVTVATDVTACAASVPVKIQRRVAGHWKTVGKTTTNDTGKYKKRIRDRAGKYRSKAPKITLDTGDVCLGARSRTVRHAL